jgi:predicted transposase YbfD/YdcC
LDGKIVRGAYARDPEGATHQDHLVSVLDQASGVVLAQVQVDAKGSEIAAFSTLLDELDVRGVLITADALHTHRGHAAYLRDRGGHYVMTVKNNQPTLLRRLRGLPWPQIGVAARERARSHGRVETRTISVVGLHPCPDLGEEFFPHAAQTIKLVRRTRSLTGGKWRTVTVYAITSLTAFQADPALLARWVRGHWHREPAALGPRRHLRRGPLPGPHRPRALGHGRVAQPRHRRRASIRRGQRRCRATPPRPRSSPTARNLLDHITTLPGPWGNLSEADSTDSHGSHGGVSGSFVSPCTHER